jgi:NAD-dependent dihydropyrimidine dehydrogenase PreA subunit
MTLFTIDHEKCDKDGICALECPAHIIEMTYNVPVPSDDAEEICIRCGHCVAVCPRAAFTLKFLSPEACRVTLFHKKPRGTEMPGRFLDSCLTWPGSFRQAVPGCHRSFSPLQGNP